MDTSSAPITHDEWMALVEATADLEVNTDWWIGRDGGEKEYAVVWSGHPDVVFWYDEGEIVSKNPGERGIRRMVELANALDARVQGDEGEFYRPDGSSFWE